MSAKETDPAQEAYRQGWANASAFGSSHRMNDLETVMWRSERHPQQSSTITTLMLLDRVPDWDRLREAHEWASSILPLMRKRVVEPVLPVGPPTWVLDADFNLDYHLRRVRLPAPAGQAELLAFTQGAAMAPFDRERPLWEATLVEGMAGAKAAYVLKLHHSLTDGQGLVQLASMVQSPTRAHTPKDAAPASVGTGEVTDPVALALSELAEQIRSAPRYAARLLSAQARVLRAPEQALGSTLRYVGSLRRTLTPSAPGSPLFAGRTGKDWRFGVMECPFPELRAAAKAASGSVNDAYVAALLGGLRRYHEQHGVTLDELPMAMPVSVRKADDPLGGNKFAGAMFAGPMGLADPEERIATVRGIVLSLRVEPAIDSLSFVTPLLNRVPSAVGARIMRAGATADLSASNVAGVSRPTYLAGALVERIHGFGPLPGVAVMSTMTTHSGTACFGFNFDGSVIADVPLMVACLEEGLAEVLALAPVASAPAPVRTTPKSARKAAPRVARAASPARRRTAPKRTAKG